MKDAPAKWPMQQDRQRGLALASALSALGHQGILAPGGDMLLDTCLSAGREGRTVPSSPAPGGLP